MQNEIILYGDELILNGNFFKDIEKQVKRSAKDIAKGVKNLNKNIIKVAKQLDPVRGVKSFIKHNPKAKRPLIAVAAVAGTILTAGALAPVLAPTASAAAGTGIFAQAGALAQAAGGSIWAGIKAVGTTLWSGVKTVGNAIGITGKAGAAANTAATSMTASGYNAGMTTLTNTVKLGISAGSSTAPVIAPVTESVSLLTKIGSAVTSTVKTLTGVASVVMPFLSKSAPEQTESGGSGLLTSPQGITGVSSPAFQAIETTGAGNAPYTIVNDSQTDEDIAQLNKKKMLIFGGIAAITLFGILIIAKRKK